MLLSSTFLTKGPGPPKQQRLISKISPLPASSLPISLYLSLRMHFPGVLSQQPKQPIQDFIEPSSQISIIFSSFTAGIAPAGRS